MKASPLPSTPTQKVDDTQESLNSPSAGSTCTGLDQPSPRQMEASPLAMPAMQNVREAQDTPSHLVALTVADQPEPVHTAGVRERPPPTQKEGDTHDSSTESPGRYL